MRTRIDLLAPPATDASTGSLLAEFEAAYRANFAPVTAFFARRYYEPETVADLVAETFAQAAASYETFDPRRGTPRAWVFGIAHRVHARQCARHVNESVARTRLTGQRPLQSDEFEEVASRVDAQREVRQLLERLDRWPAEKAALELVDLVGLAPPEAARALSVSVPTLRVRLFRARRRLGTKELSRNESA
jgi:RNA polymerase sigma-70 factor (ECF subfamily)